MAKRSVGGSVKRCSRLQLRRSIDCACTALASGTVASQSWQAFGGGERGRLFGSGGRQFEVHGD
jgi:hypothetical protein